MIRAVVVQVLWFWFFGSGSGSAPLRRGSEPDSIFNVFTSSSHSVAVVVDDSEVVSRMVVCGTMSCMLQVMCKSKRGDV
jgi:hypothetical protein